LIRQMAIKNPQQIMSLAIDGADQKVNLSLSRSPFPGCVCVCVYVYVYVDGSHGLVIYVRRHTMRRTSLASCQWEPNSGIMESKLPASCYLPATSRCLLCCCYYLCCLLLLCCCTNADCRIKQNLMLLRIHGHSNQCFTYYDNCAAGI